MKRYLCFLLMLMAFTVANAQSEICNNGIDDDGDGFIDYYDGDCSSQLTDLQRDSLALVALYHATDGDNWTNNENWLVGPVSTWSGVYTNSEGVQMVYLMDNNLNGFLPPEIGTLGTRFLDLSFNNLSGSIPPEMGNMPKLDSLGLAHNALTGEIPEELVDTTRYYYDFDLSHNKLIGMIPSTMKRGTYLHTLNLSSNYLSKISDEPWQKEGHVNIVDNNFTFEDVIPIMKKMNYTGQRLVGHDTTVAIGAMESYTIRLEIDNYILDNKYVWFKDGIAIDTTDINYYTLEETNASGVYTCRVTNPRAHLVLYSHPTIIQVNSTRQPQKIQFDSLSNVFVSDTLLLQASASSELPVIFEVSGPAQLDSNQLVLTDTGQVTVTAQQPGDSVYLPAQNILRMFWVEEVTPSEDTPIFYSVSGSVWQKENMPFQGGTVVLYEVKLRYFALYTQELKDSHTYQFDSLPKGNYTIGVLVNDSSYLPTYWGGHYLMFNAEKILVQQNIEELNITLLSTPVIATRGTAIIRGTLIGQKTNNGRLANAESDASLAHVHVYLQNTQGALVAHTVTNEQGEFIFENLPEGAYRFVADYEGVAFPEKTIRAIKDQETVITASVAGDVNISTEESVDQVTSAFGEIVTKLVKIFPNPVTSTVSVKTDDIQWLGGTISLQNVVGRVVTQVPIQNTIMVMDIADQPAGIYLLTIRKNGTVETRKIVKQ